MDDIKKTFTAEMLIVFGIMISVIVLLLRGGWIEPDSYAFYNYFCLSGKSFDIPILSNYFFDKLPCTQYLWYGFQAFIWWLCFVALIDANKIFNNIKDWKNGIIGLSLSFIYGVLALEDDFLAFPLIVYGTWGLLKGDKKQKILGLLCFIVATFFWKGTLLIGAIVLASKINWKIGIGVVLIYIFNNGTDTWGGSSEAVFGLGFVTLFPFLILLFYSTKEKVLAFRQNNVFFWTLPFILLTLYQVKWGLYTILFLPVWLIGLIDDEVFQKKLVVLAGVVFVLSIIGLGLTKSPNSNHWAVVQEAVDLQKAGYVVKNDWSVGRFIEYLGGKATQAGGYSGFQNVFPGEYWIGPDRNCFTISKTDLLFLQKC